MTISSLILKTRRQIPTQAKLPEQFQKTPFESKMTSQQAQGSYFHLSITPGSPRHTPTIENVESFPRIHTGVKIEPVQPASSSLETQPMGINTQSGEIATDDPFAAQRTEGNNPFGDKKNDLGVVGLDSGSHTTNAAPVDRRMSKEWGMLCPVGLGKLARLTKLV